MMLRLGAVFPVSHKAMVDWVTPNRFAKSLWLRPAAWRAPFMVEDKLMGWL
jgi:hypothetical protein